MVFISSIYIGSFYSFFKIVYYFSDILHLSMHIVDQYGTTRPFNIVAIITLWSQSDSPTPLAGSESGFADCLSLNSGFFLFLCVCLVIFNQMLGLTYREAIAIEANIIYTLKWAPFFYQYMWVIGLI